MKGFKLLFVLGVVLCLASCNTKPKTNQVATQEWNFDLMWQVFMTMPNKGYDMEEEDTIRSVRERTRQDYEQQAVKNRLYVYTEDFIPCGQSVEIKCFKYQDADKLFVFYAHDEECGACNYYTRSFTYDLKDGSLNEIELPMMPLKIRDFFDDATVSEYTESQWEELVGNNCGITLYILDYEKADLLLSAEWFIDYELEGRDNRLAFDWNGSEFVRKPEADILGKK